MKLNRIVCVALAVLLLLSAVDLAAAGKYNKRFSLFGGLNMFGASGSESDYVAGENDFPVIPSYQAPFVGLSIAFSSSRLSAWGLDFRYGLAGTVDRRDPSDNETVSVDTPQNLAAILFIQRSLIPSGPLSLFVLIGGGVEYRMATEKEYVSSLGSKIVVGKPDKPLAPLVAGGLGLQYMLGGRFGVGAECRVSYAVRKPAQMIIAPALALVVKF
jgi:hypothetical protein